MFVEFVKAYDKMNKVELWNVLYEYGVQDGWLNVL